MAKETGRACDFIGMPIAGHHAGLYDHTVYNDLKFRDTPDDIDKDNPKIGPVKPGPLPVPKYAHHLIRMLFSSLVDADYLDTGKIHASGAIRRAQMR